MPDIGWSELALVAVIALIIIGPKDLPRILRTAGRWAGKARAMANDFRSSVDTMVREAEIDDVKKDVESVARYDVSKEIENSIDPTGEMAREISQPPSESDTKTEPANEPADEPPASAEGAEEASPEPAPDEEAAPPPGPDDDLPSPKRRSGSARAGGAPART